MDLRIEINMDNAAFQDGGGEAARILRDVADDCESGQLKEVGDWTTLMDYNGNAVGKAKVVK